jgi:hypothetical protein
MSKIVVFKITEGDWQQGFSVIMEIGEEGQSSRPDFAGKLPSSSDLPQYYQKWQSSYFSLSRYGRVSASPNQVTNSSSILNNCQKAAQELEISLNSWLNSETFRPLKEQLLAKLHRSESVRVFIQTSDLQLRCLPWHLWDFFKTYKQAEVILSTPIFDPENPPIVNSGQKQLRILAILGDSQGINIDADRKFLENLPKAKVHFLVQPERREITDQLWDQSWDILFFAGHSCTKQEKGKIFINSKDSLTLGDLKHGLSLAIKNGLQLAIFNSCQGLGIAKELEELSIPQVIVMREPVPDVVAQNFLKHFLGRFSQGEPLHLAIKTARERLQDEGLDQEIPGATWLPIFMSTSYGDAFIMAEKTVKRISLFRNSWGIFTGNNGGRIIKIWARFGLLSIPGRGYVRQNGKFVRAAVPGPTLRWRFRLRAQRKWQNCSKLVNFETAV